MIGDISTNIPKQCVHTEDGRSTGRCLIRVLYLGAALSPVAFCICWYAFRLLRLAKEVWLGERRQKEGTRGPEEVTAHETSLSRDGPASESIGEVLLSISRTAPAGALCQPVTFATRTCADTKDWPLGGIHLVTGWSAKWPPRLLSRIRFGQWHAAVWLQPTRSGKHAALINININIIIDHPPTPPRCLGSLAGIV